MLQSHDRFVIDVRRPRRATQRAQARPPNGSTLVRPRAALLASPPALQRCLICVTAHETGLI